MNNNDLLKQLLRSAGRAGPAGTPADEHLPFALETRILAARRQRAGPDEPDPFLSLFRAAFGCATLIALLCVVFHYYDMRRVEDYQASLNYTINSAFAK